MKETEIASAIVDWLQEQKYVVYQEVMYGDCVADIVVDINGHGWIIETKTSLGLSVIGQAWKWTQYGVKRVSVGVPHSASRNYGIGRNLAYTICRDYGIGILEVRKDSSVVENYLPRFSRHKFFKKRDIIDVCNDKHKTMCPAGSSRGGYWTPYKETMDTIRSKLVLEKDWVRLSDIMQDLEHHYASNTTAKACMASRLQDIERDWCESRKNGRYLEFRLRRKDSDDAEGTGKTD